MEMMINLYLFIEISFDDGNSVSKLKEQKILSKELIDLRTS